MRFAPLILAATLVAPAAAHAGVRPGSPPPICGGNAFSDQVGTPADDTLTSPGPAQRIYGLRGSDQLTGSRTRATCLFGGPENDILNLESGGGVAWGEEGRDLIFGSPFGDIVVGGRGIDAAATGGGPDKVDFRDGRPEVVNCGDGEDMLTADRVDLRIGCESVTVSGPDAPRLQAQPDRTGVSGSVRARMTMPRGAAAGRYQLLYVRQAVDDSCAGTGVVGTLPRVRRGQRIRFRVRAPELGWCAGKALVAVIRDPGRSLPTIPVARFSFRVR